MSGILTGSIVSPLEPFATAWYIRDMTSTLFMNGRSQAVRLPKHLRLPGTEVSIRRLGNGVLIEPVTAKRWPDGFLESIRIADPDFGRPEQGITPPSPSFETDA